MSGRLAKILEAQRQAALDGAPGNPSAWAEIEAVLDEYYRNTIVPLLARSRTDCAYATAHISTALGWARQVELLGLTQGDADPRITAIWDAVGAALQNCWKEATSGKCLRMSPAQIKHLLSLARTMALYGIGLPDGRDPTRSTPPRSACAATSTAGSTSWTSSTGRRGLPVRLSDQGTCVDHCESRSELVRGAAGRALGPVRGGCRQPAGCELLPADRGALQGVPDPGVHLGRPAARHPHRRRVRDASDDGAQLPDRGRRCRHGDRRWLDQHRAPLRRWPAVRADRFVRAGGDPAARPASSSRPGTGRSRRGAATGRRSR